MFNEEVFYDACVEEIVNENTLKLAIRLDDSKVIKTFYLHNLDAIEASHDNSELKSLFMVDILNSVLPVGTFVKVKISDEKVNVFNKGLNKNINNLIRIIQESNANYVM